MVVAKAEDDGDAGSPSNRKWNEELVLGSVAAGIAWAIALVLFIRKWLKRRRRAMLKAELHRASTQKASNKYGSIEDLSEENTQDGEEEGSSLGLISNKEVNKVPSQPSPCTVISFTALGALDEVSYFPSLLLGEIFTPRDLCLGTFFAACLILAVVTLFLSLFKPLLAFLDRIPLYVIVTSFAVVLTIGVVIDVISVDTDE